MRFDEQDYEWMEQAMEGTIMMRLNRTLRKATVGLTISLLVVGFCGLAWAADLYSLPGEDGLELFLLDNHLQAPVLNLRENAGSRVTVGDDGSLTFSPTDSLAKYFGLNEGAKNAEPRVGYRGFRTSPLGRVLNVEGEFSPNLGPASIETANSQQAVERRFDLGQPQAGRTGWEQDLGIRILSF